MIPQECNKNIELFSAQVDNLLLQNIAENLYKHLEDCRECRKTFQEMETIKKLLAGLDPSKPPDDFETGLLKTAKMMLARKSALRHRLKYVSYGLGIAALILALLTAFLYPGLVAKIGLLITPQVAANKTEQVVQTSPRLPNGKTMLMQSILAEKLARIEKERLLSDPPPHTVIRNEKEWANIWRLQNAGRNVSALVPEVDFNNKMVVAIISQDDKSEYIITEVEEKENGVIIICAGTSLTHKNPPLPLYQFRIVPAKPTVTFQMTRTQ